MERTLLQRIHNPRNLVCACDPDCWCRRTALGRAVKWWLPAGKLGLRHRNRRLEEWKRRQPDELDRAVEHQPKYESIVRLGPMRFGMTVRLPNGQTVVHELAPVRFRSGS